MTAIDGSRDQAALATRVQTALAARREGKTWQQVADACGYTNRGAAYNAVMGHLRGQLAANVGAMREDANARHAAKIAMLEDVMYDVDAPLADRLRAADAHTRAEVQNARLNGTNAPVQVAISAGVKAELADALGELEEVLRLHEQPDGSYAAEDQDGPGA